jgi:energy-coupling factor transport system ATP-binding protein
MTNQNAPTPVLRVERAAVAFRTPQGVQTALSGITMDIAEGEWVALVGRNGSGKSTLAKLIAGLCPLSQGTIAVHPGKRVQLVLQDPEAQIVGETVYEDICFGLENAAADPSAMEQKVRAALDAVGLKVPPERPTRELSGGQKQLLAVAGCLALDAEVLVFDEATSMLDPMSRQRLLEAVRSLHRAGKTIVWVTQLLEEAAYADRVVALDRQGVVYDGGNRSFFYDAGCPADPGPCENLGFTPPFPVQVAKKLLRGGRNLPVLPVTAAELCGAVRALCRS